MDRDRTFKDTKINVEDIIEQVGDPLLEQYETYSKDIPGISVEEQTENRDEMDSTHQGVKLFIKNRDPNGINDFLKVISSSRSSCTTKLLVQAEQDILSKIVLVQSFIYVMSISSAMRCLDDGIIANQFWKNLLF